MKLETRFSKGLFEVTIILLLFFSACNSQMSGQSSTALPTNQGFLTIYVRDFFALLGFLALCEKAIRALFSSARSGRIRGFYSRYLIRYLLTRAYKNEDAEKIDRLLEDIAINKLNSDYEEKRSIGIKELAAMPPSKRIFLALILALEKEISKPIRLEIIRALNLHFDYDSGN
jgi:hypothetical protein